LEGDKKSAIKTRKCRRHYGTDFHTTFDASKHKEADAFIDSFTGVKKASNQMEWLLTLGQDLPTSKEAHAKASFNYSFWPGQRRVSNLVLFASNAPKAPQRSVDQVSASSKRMALFITH